MAKQQQFEFSLLGDSFHLVTEDDPKELQERVDFLASKIANAKERFPDTSPLKLSILASLFLADELIALKKESNEKSRQEELEEMGIRASKMIDSISEIL